MEELAVESVQVVAITHQLEACTARISPVEEVEEIPSRQVEDGFIQFRHSLSLATPPLRVAALTCLRHDAG
jgi:hypothetical protein